VTNPSVAIIGSFRRYYKQIADAAREFEAAGICVTSPTVSRIVNPGDQYVRFETDCQHSADHTIQRIVLSRILNSDLIYVVVPEGYIGRTTCYELGRVQERGIPVFFSEPPRDLPIEIPHDSVLDPATLARRILEFYDTRNG